MSSIPFDDAAVLDCFRAVLNDHPKSMRGDALNYMFKAVDDGYKGHILHTQVLYILNNLDNWRGEDARRIKTELRSYLKARCNKGCFL